MVIPDVIRPAITPVVGGSVLVIEVTAGSRVEKFPAGYNEWRHAVGIQVKAPAVEGKANKAIIHLIAENLQISRTAITIISGHTSSMKRVQIEGITPEDLEKSLITRI